MTNSASRSCALEISEAAASFLALLTSESSEKRKAGWSENHPSTAESLQRGSFYVFGAGRLLNVKVLERGKQEMAT